MSAGLGFSLHKLRKDWGGGRQSLPQDPSRWKWPRRKELGRKPHGWRSGGERPTLESLEEDSAAQKAPKATAGAKASGNTVPGRPVARPPASRANWAGGGGGLNLAGKQGRQGGEADRHLLWGRATARTVPSSRPFSRVKPHLGVEEGRPPFMGYYC